MTALTKGMFDQFRSPGAFGLYSSQMRSSTTKLVHNGSWYNQAGQKLGWGDISALDLQRISDEIEEGEAFIVLQERDSHWDYIRRFPSGDPSEKGVDYVAKHASYMVLKKRLYCVEPHKSDRTKYTELGIELDIIHPNNVMELLKPFG